MAFPGMASSFARGVAGVGDLESPVDRDWSRIPQCSALALAETGPLPIGQPLYERAGLKIFVTPAEIVVFFANRFSDSWQTAAANFGQRREGKQ